MQIDTDCIRVRMKQYQCYTTNRQMPKVVKYWDKIFRKTQLFFPWQAALAAVEYHVPMVQQELSLSKKEARDMVWSAFCDAITGDVNSAFFPEYDDLCQMVTDDTMPIFTMAMTVGVDIHAGYSEREAIEEFKIWLAEDPRNGVFGNYRINSDLSVQQVR